MPEPLEPSHDPSSDSLRAGFLALLPQLQTHVLMYFRNIACPDTRADNGRSW